MPSISYQPDADFVGSARRGIAVIRIESPPRAYVEARLHWLSEQTLVRTERALDNGTGWRKRATQIYLREALSRITGIAPDVIQFSTTGKGKPVLLDSTSGTPAAGTPAAGMPAAGMPTLHFNVSDTVEETMIVVSATRRVGIDIELLGRHFNHKGIIERFFHADEQAVAAALSDSQCANWALWGWTRKEALGKAVGCGVRYPMNKYALMHDFPQPIIAEFGDAHWNVRSHFDPLRGICLSLAHDGDALIPTFIEYEHRQWLKQLQ